MQMNTTYLHRGVEILLAEESDKHAQIRSTAQEPTPKLSDNSISATSSCMKIQKKTSSQHFSTITIIITHNNNKCQVTSTVIPFPNG